MPKLTITCGLPGSGKSCWARAQQDVWLAGRDRFRRDFTGAWPHGDQESEDLITALQSDYIGLLLSVGRDVIVDDTNLDPAHCAALEELAHDCGASVHVADFRHVPVAECIANDAKRSGAERVGEERIRAMAEKWGLA